MCDFGQHMCRCETGNLSTANSIEEVRARASVRGIQGAMIDQGVGIDKNAVTGRQVGKSHGVSPKSYSRSGSIAAHSISAASEQGTMPRVRCTQSTGSATVI